MTTARPNSVYQHCSSCARANLPGGLRCVYCGNRFPTKAAKPVVAPAIPAQSKARRGGILGSLAILVAKIKAALVFLKFGSILLTLSTMLVAYKFYAYFYGWKFGLGILLSIFVHEMGHVYVNRAKGLKSSSPIFLPLMGAVIFLKGFPDDPAIQSEAGAGGPVAGAFGALFCLLVGFITHNPFWYGLANFGFLINLFNLTPFPPLDGSHISTVFSPRQWNFALITLLLFVIKFPTPILWGVLIIGFVIRLGIGDNRRYLLAAPEVRTRMTALYIALCIVLSLGFQATVSARFGAYAASSKGTVVVQHAQIRQRNSMANNAPSKFHHPKVDLAIPFVLGGMAVGLWFVVSGVLARAVRRPVLSRILLLPIGILLANAVYLAFMITVPNPTNVEYSMVIMELPMGAAALFYALWSVFHRDNQTAPVSYSELVGRSVLWGTAVSVIMAYAYNNIGILVTPILAITICLVMLRWLPYAMFAGSCLVGADFERAAHYAEIALRHAPPPENERTLITCLAVNYASKNMATACLTEVERARRLPGRSFQDEVCLILEVRSWIYSEQYDKAIVGIENLLKFQSRSTLMAAQVLLANLARYRGWLDDAEARIRMLLTWKSVQALPGATKLKLDLVATLVDSGQLEKAQAEIAALKRASLEASDRRRMNLLEAEIEVALGRVSSALEIIDQLPRQESGLEERFRLARLQDTIRLAEGRTFLEDLASSHPVEAWGKRAARLLLGEEELLSVGEPAISFEF